MPCTPSGFPAPIPVALPYQLPRRSATVQKLFSRRKDIHRIAFDSASSEFYEYGKYVFKKSDNRKRSSEEMASHLGTLG